MGRRQWSTGTVYDGLLKHALLASRKIFGWAKSMDIMTGQTGKRRTGMFWDIWTLRQGTFYGLDGTEYAPGEPEKRRLFGLIK